MQESHKSPDLTQTQATLMGLSMYKLKWLINILNAANKKGKYFGGEGTHGAGPTVTTSGQFWQWVLVL